MVLNGVSSEEGLIVAGDIAWTDYDVETSAVVLADSLSNRDASLVVRYKDPNNFYWMGIGPWGHFASISRVVNGVTEELVFSGVDTDVVFGQKYTLKAVLRGNLLQLFVYGPTGELLATLEQNDTSHLNGAIGLRIWGSHVQFDYLSAVSPVGTVPPPNPLLIGGLLTIAIITVIVASR